MRRDHFHRDLDDYLAHRRKLDKKNDDCSAVPVAKKVELPKQEEVEMPPEVDTEEVTPRKSWFAWLFGSDEEEVVEEQAKPLDEVAVRNAIETEQLRSDIKEVAKFALATFKELPPDKLGKLKSSPDFERFKDVLRKNSVIK